MHHPDSYVPIAELVVLQAVLLSLLILVSLLWAFCCKRRCLTDRSALVHEVVAFARYSIKTQVNQQPHVSREDNLFYMP